MHCQANGNARECATSSLLDSPMYKEAKDRDYIEDIIRAAVGSMYTGGADTVRLTFSLLLPVALKGYLN